jgi:hypothetical protein
VQQNIGVNRSYDGPRRTLIYIDRKSTANNPNAIKSVKIVSGGKSIHYMILVDNVFQHGMRLLETQVPLTFSMKVMVYWSLQANSCRCT